MENIINWGLLREPINWFVIWTMALVLWFLFEAVSRHPANVLSADENS